MYSFNILSVHHIPHMLWKMGRTGPGASNVIYQSKKRRAASQTRSGLSSSMTAAHMTDVVRRRERQFVVRR
jgi:hypothetical protein